MGALEEAPEPREYGRMLQGRESGRLDNQIHVVNPVESNWTKRRFLLCFGAYGWTKLLVWANRLEGALDEAIDWIADNEPGLLCDEQVEEDYREALARLTEERPDEDPDVLEKEAREEAEEDTTCGGNYGNRILSYEWGIIAEDPTRAQLLSVMDRDREPRNARERRAYRKRQR